MKSTLIRRVEKLEKDIVPGKDKFSAIFRVVVSPSVPPGAPVEKGLVNGWTLLRPTGVKVMIMRQPGEDDESLKGRAIEAGKASLSEGVMPTFVSAYDK